MGTCTFSPAGGSAGPASYLGHALGVAAYEVIFGPGGDLYGVASQTNGNVAAEEWSSQSADRQDREAGD